MVVVVITREQINISVVCLHVTDGLLFINLSCVSMDMDKEHLEYRTDCVVK